MCKNPKINLGYFYSLKKKKRDFPGGAVAKNPPANAGDWVQSLVQEDPTCHGATKPASHNYRAQVPQLLKPTRLEPVLRNKRSHRNKKPVHHNEE